MLPRFSALALAAGLLACSIGPGDARGGTVQVYEDEGTFSFKLVANGLGTVSATYADVVLTKINDVLIPTGSIASSFLPASGVVTSTTTTGQFTSITLDQAVPSLKEFGTGVGSIDTATLMNKVLNGTATRGFLNLNGEITKVVSPLLETTATAPTVYDFSPFSLGGSITLTFNKVGADFAAVLAKGGTITGTGAVTEVASVPEPCSVALLGIGLSGLLAFRRVFKRAKLA